MAAGERLAACAVTVYTPAGNSARTYPPSVPVMASCVKPVPVFFAERVAPAITLPLGSVTLPRMEPRKLCAAASPASRKINALRAETAVRCCLPVIVPWPRGLKPHLVDILRRGSSRAPAKADLLPFASDENRLRRFHSVGGGEAPLIDGKADASARVDE